MRFHAIPTQIIVKAVGAPIFDSTATKITVVDEGSGRFIRITQPDEERPAGGIAITALEWPTICDSVQKMLNVSQGLNVQPLPSTGADKQ